MATTPMSREAPLSSTIRILVWVALAGLAGSWFLVALTWDGGYSVFCTLQYQRQMTPHNRWINEVLEWPGLHFSSSYTNPAWCARFYGAMNYGIVLATTAAVLALLRRRLVHLRKWGVALALIVPTPGILCACSETIPAVEMFAVLMALIWTGPRWWAVPFIALVAWMLWGTHPLGLVLYGAAALCAGWMAWSGRATGRMIPGAVALALAATSVGRFITLLSGGTEYEHSQMSAWLLLNEFAHAFIASPWLAIPFAFWLLVSKRAENPRLRRRAVIGMFVVTATFSVCPVLWNGELDYRKFGAFVAVVFALAGTQALVRGRAGPPGDKTAARDDAVLTVRFAQVYACALLVGTFSWVRLCSRFLTAMDRSPVAWVDSAEVPWLRHTALDHWGATPTSLVLQQTKEPKHGYLCPGSRVRNGGVEMFPAEWLELNDAWFKLAPLRPALPAAKLSDP